MAVWIGISLLYVVCGLLLALLPRITGKLSALACRWVAAV